MNRDLFHNPPNAYREIPFWSWNDVLEPGELRRQIGLIHQGGWGGFFMHARIGLRTAYMGKQWMEAVHASVAAARELGLGAWLYDEDQWPSGFAGGLSSAPRADYRAQYLVCKVDNRPALVEERIATYAAREVNGQLVDLRVDPSPPFENPEDRLVQFYVQTMPLGDTTWFNGYAYLNLLNREAVRLFIETTHEVYRREVGADFGETIPGLFTDEPCTYFRVNQAANPAASLPWVQNLPEEFARRRGYDLLPHLAALFFDTGRADDLRVRYHYWLTVTELFVENYTTQIADWCKRSRLRFTGHFMSEDSMLTQIQWGLAAAMPHYPRMDYPGVDKLGRQIGATYGTILTVKQLDSAACQSGKERILIENYALGGQDFAHRGRKWLGDWGAVLGANLHNLHLSLYSMRGERKRDCPPNLSFQQPWWPENRLISDYIARLSYALSQGQRVVDLLVIHPMGSAWALYRPGGTAQVETLDRRLDETLTLLMRSQRDFHLGDEGLIRPGGDCAARVEAGEDGPRLRVGVMTYRGVIVPPGVTLAENTVELLREFSAVGGPVLALEPAPTRIEGLPSENVLPKAARRLDLDGLAAALDELLPFDARVEGMPDVWVHHRRAGELDWYFLANTSLETGGAATVRLRGEGGLERWDLTSGLVEGAAGRQDNGVIEVDLEFPPAGSHLLLLRRDAPRAAAQAPVRIETNIDLNGEWKLDLRRPNALTLDHAALSIAGGEWSEPLYVLDAQTRMAQLGVGTPFRLRFEFDMDPVPVEEMELVLESPDHFAITLNGAEVDDQRDHGFWYDAAFRRLGLPGGSLRPGCNEITLSGVFRTDSELESVYLSGAFGVQMRRLGEEKRSNGQVFDCYAPDRRITALPIAASGAAPDLTAGGLPFYAGTAGLSRTVTLAAPVTGPARIELDNLNAAVVRVRVNGQDCGAAAWEPYQWDVGSALRAGENRIEFEITSTLRNLLGPHHLRGGDPIYTGPDSYRGPRGWTEDWILVPFGFSGARLVIYG